MNCCVHGSLSEMRTVVVFSFHKKTAWVQYLSGRTCKTHQFQTAIFSCYILVQNWGNSIEGTDGDERGFAVSAACGDAYQPCYLSGGLWNSPLPSSTLATWEAWWRSSLPFWTEQMQNSSPMLHQTFSEVLKSKYCAKHFSPVLCVQYFLDNSCLFWCMCVHGCGSFTKFSPATVAFGVHRFEVWTLCCTYPFI